MINASSMPRKPLNYDRPMYEADGSYTRLPAGAYVCQITDVSGDTQRQYVSLILDIADGEYINYYSGVYYADKAWQHSKRLYYTERAIPSLKSDLSKITASNPEFDAEEAFWNDPNALIGKYIGAEFVEEEYYSRAKGTFEIGAPRPTYLVTTDQALIGLPARPPRMMSIERKAQALQRAGISDWQGALETIEAAKRIRESIAETGGFSIHRETPAPETAPAPAAPQQVTAYRRPAPGTPETEAPYGQSYNPASVVAPSRVVAQ